jgi:hypothetical protein
VEQSEASVHNREAGHTDTMTRGIYSEKCRKTVTKKSTRRKKARCLCGGVWFRVTEVEEVQSKEFQSVSA